MGKLYLYLFTYVIVVNWILKKIRFKDIFKKKYADKIPSIFQPKVVRL